MKKTAFICLTLALSLLLMASCSTAEKTIISGDMAEAKPFMTIELDYDFPTKSPRDNSSDIRPDGKYIKINGELKQTEKGYYGKAAYSFDVTPDQNGRVTVVMPWTGEKNEFIWRVKNSDVNVLFLSYYSVGMGEMIEGEDRCIGMCVLEPTDKTEKIELQYIFIRDPQGEKKEEIQTTVTLNIR